MSGFAGWADGRGDLSGRAHLVSRMANGLEARGVRPPRLCAGRHVVLAHRDGAGAGGDDRGLSTATEDGRTVGAVVFDGALTNAGDVRAALAARGRTPRGGSEAEVVLLAVLEWGVDAPARLDGAFAFAAWDETAGRLLLCRDRFGVKPLTYVPLPDGSVAFASELSALVAHPQVAAELDAEGLCRLLSQVRAPGTSILRGMREVAPGHVLAVGPDGRRTESPYWRLEALPHEHGPAETVAAVRDLLGEAIHRESGGAAPAVLLSGGLDSSALAGLTAHAAAPAPRTFTLAFGGDRAAPTPDAPYVADVVRHLGCRHQDVWLSADELTDPEAEAAVLAAKDFPSPFGDKNVSPYLFYRQVAQQVPTALSGEAADAVFSGLAGARERESGGGRTFPWIERAQRLGMPHGIGNGLIAPEVLRRVDLAGHCESRWEEARAEVPHLPGAPAADRRARELDYVHLTRLCEQTVTHSERLAAAAGLDVRFPFFDHRLVTYLYNVPWEMKSSDGREKSLLRAAARDVLPRSVLTRPKAPFPITYHPRYKQRLQDRLRRLLEDDSAPVRPLVDLPAARRVAEDAGRMDRGGWLGRADAELLLQLDGWLRRLRVTVRL